MKQKMERNYRKSNSLINLDKRLKMKINEHKMLTNTLHEAFRNPNSTESTLNSIKKAIDETLNEIALLRDESSGTAISRSIFDRIDKKKEQAIGVLSGYEPKYSYKKQHKVKSFDDIKKPEDEINEILQKRIDNGDLSAEPINLGEKMNVDNILLCNRFLFDVSVLGIPVTMIKWVNVVNDPQRFIEFEIYDFVDEEGVPILAKLNNYDSRKFVAEIKHLNPAGGVVYKEKFNGCYLDPSIRRDSLRYSDSEPSTIMLKIYYDGVSYETGN